MSLNVAGLRLAERVLRSMPKRLSAMERGADTVPDGVFATECVLADAASGEPGASMGKRGTAAARGHVENVTKSVPPSEYGRRCGCPDRGKSRIGYAAWL